MKKTPLKYYVGINARADRRQVFGVHGKPTARSHGKQFSAVIGPFASLRAALYVRDHGFNNPKIRCPGDAEKLCRVRSLPPFQRTPRRLAGRKRKLRKNPSRAEKLIRRRGGAVRFRTIKRGKRRLTCAVTRKRGSRGGKTVCFKRNPSGGNIDIRDIKGIRNAIRSGATHVYVKNGNLEGLLLASKLGPKKAESITAQDVKRLLVY